MVELDEAFRFGIEVIDRHTERFGEIETCSRHSPEKLD